MTDTITDAAEPGPLARAIQDEPERPSWDSQAKRVVTLYIPLALFVIVAQQMQRAVHHQMAQVIGRPLALVARFAQHRLTR